MNDILDREHRRLEAQHSLDSRKDHGERNRLGQFATPPALAEEILKYADSILPSGTGVRFLDPAIGTGSFYSALMRVFPTTRIERALGYEIDADYAKAARGLFSGTPLTVETEDFTAAKPPASDRGKFNLLICNPPYVRHHHIARDEKVRLHRLVERMAAVKLSGLSGIYCYFLCLSDAWLAPGGIAGWLIPSEFMDVNYGRELRRYLVRNVHLLRIHRFDPAEVQFDDALVSSALVWYQKKKPPAEYSVEFTQSGDLLRPGAVRIVGTDALLGADKWSKLFAHQEEAGGDRNQARLSDMFIIKRGIATGANEFFVLSSKKIEQLHLPGQFLKPVLPPPRHLETDEIPTDESGVPRLEQRLFLLACDLDPEVVKARHPDLWRYLEGGIEKGVNARYLCKNRTPWYSQENRPPAPLLCTYMGRSSLRRGSPFRFILNHSQATATNVYLMLYPKPSLAAQLKTHPDLLRNLWKTLNGLSPDTLTREGRVYGGGLHKLEPRELANVQAGSLLKLVTKPIESWA